MSKVVENKPRFYMPESDEEYDEVEMRIMMDALDLEPDYIDADMMPKANHMRKRKQEPAAVRVRERKQTQALSSAELIAMVRERQARIMAQLQRMASTK